MVDGLLALHDLHDACVEHEASFCEHLISQFLHVFLGLFLEDLVHLYHLLLARVPVVQLEDIILLHAFRLPETVC